MKRRRPLLLPLSLRVPPHRGHHDFDAMILREYCGPPQPHRSSTTHAFVRTYSGAGAKQLFEVLEQRKADVETTLRKVPGLVSYTLLGRGDGGMSITVCRIRQASRRARKSRANGSRRMRRTSKRIRQPSPKFRSSVKSIAGALHPAAGSPSLPALGMRHLSTQFLVRRKSGCDPRAACGEPPARLRDLRSTKCGVPSTQDDVRRGRPVS